MEKVGRRAFTRPNEKELKELNKTMTRQELATHYNVSIGLIAKWLREAGLVRNHYMS